MTKTPLILASGICVFWLAPLVTRADVKTVAADGFRIETVQTTRANADVTYRCLVDNFSKWWDSDHTYSGQAENMSMDLNRQALYETLENGGFVRHMEIVYHQPGSTLRLAGGLGPLQGMGVTGALTFQLTPGDGKTEIRITYIVSGNSSAQLDQVAAAVDSVLTDQLKRLAEYCDRQ